MMLPLALTSTIMVILVEIYVARMRRIQGEDPKITFKIIYLLFTSLFVEQLI